MRRLGLEHFLFTKQERQREKKARKRNKGFGETKLEEGEESWS